jgi:hypothetical protein
MPEPKNMILASTIHKDRPTIYMTKGEPDEIRRLAVMENFWVNGYSLTAAVGQGSNLGTILRHEFFNAPRDAFNTLIRHATYELSGLSFEQKQELVVRAIDQFKLALADKVVIPLREEDFEAISGGTQVTGTPTPEN